MCKTSSDVTAPEEVEHARSGVLVYLLHGPASQEGKLSTERHMFGFVAFANAEEDVEEVVAVDTEHRHPAAALDCRRPPRLVKQGNLLRRSTPSKHLNNYIDLQIGKKMLELCKKSKL